MIFYSTVVQICTGRIVPFEVKSLGVEWIDIYFGAYSLPYIAGHGESYIDSCQKAHALLNRLVFQDN